MRRSKSRRRSKRRRRRRGKERGKRREQLWGRLWKQEVRWGNDAFRTEGGKETIQRERVRLRQTDRHTTINQKDTKTDTYMLRDKDQRHRHHHHHISPSSSSSSVSSSVLSSSLL